MFEFDRTAQYEDKISKLASNLKKADANSDKEITSLRASLEQSRQAHRLALSEKETEIVLVAKLRKEIVDLKDAQEKSKVEMDVVSTLESALRAEQSRTLNLTNTVSRLEAEKAEKPEVVAQLESQSSALNSQLAAATAELQSCRRQLHALQQDYMHVKSTLEFETSKRKVFEYSNSDFYDDEVCIVCK